MAAIRRASKAGALKDPHSGQNESRRRSKTRLAADEAFGERQEDNSRGTRTMRKETMVQHSRRRHPWVLMAIPFLAAATIAQTQVSAETRQADVAPDVQAYAQTY